MATKSGMRVIAIEEHYADAALIATYGAWRNSNPAQKVERLLDVGEVRLREMDEAGIDVQVLSHTNPATQLLDAETGVALARRTNDTLGEVIRRHPQRFAGFAVLPTADPKASADELERTVTQLGFKGAMVHGLANGQFLDRKSFWPIFERAQALDVPIYIHPSTPHPTVVDVYYKDYPALVRAGWGFGVETATHALRLIMSGLFDAYPKLKIVLGHLGEGLPFLLWRSDHIIMHEAKLPRSLRDYFCEHFYVTTSGNFSFPALQCCLLELGVDKIIFSVDWPWATNTEGVNFLESAPLSRADKEKIFHGNVEQLLKM